MRAVGLVTIPGLAVIVVGVFGPWAIFSEDHSRSGTHPDFLGPLVLATAGIGFLVAFAYTWGESLQLPAGRRVAVAALLVSGLIDLFVAIDLYQVATHNGSDIGQGLWITVAGSLAFTAGTIATFIDARRRPFDYREWA